MERGGLVYVCDDTAQIRRLIRVNLELEGYEVREAGDGEELVAALHDLETLPGVITVDAQMTPRDGWWTIAHIRADPRLAHIPVIMVTASVQQHDRAQAQGSGLDAFLAKPFDPDHLLDLVSGFMAEGRAHTPAP
ncbi:Response regulator receiver domain-containing protein [Pedococcus dokdonensis]|uniref:Response regulator receiver domain-containing protein n=1 Tax=Pedococcus dokdonensis TaxID=443156 RepID=A0A1H0LBQ5_9MICO|nr:response regulator [Pedococcus dokdonensis]SDO65618.1 Response regulator receiver domain-containing protein [Pedococcus dokdonensis]